MLLKIYPDNPSERLINTVIDVLQKGGVIIYPTDTVYGLGCDITKPKAIEKIAQIKGIKKEKANFSFIAFDLSHISDFTRPIPNNIFKIMKRVLPGPYTFILNANNNVPQLLQRNKKTVGIRVPNNNIPTTIVKLLGNPILTTSVHDDDELIEYTTDPELIHEKFGNLVDIVIDGGYGGNIPSTVVDCTTDEPIIVREGLGDIAEIY